MKNKSFFPTLILVIICLVISGALVGANSVTRPQIDKITKENADKARAEVFTQSKSFTEYKGKLDDGILEYYVADNKSGVVVTSTSKSFGGTMTVMVGIDKAGAITGVKVTNHADTPGLGTKAMTPEYLKQYQGIGIDKMQAAKVKDNQNVDYIVGASISSGGVYDAVKGALQQFKDVGGVK